MTTNAMSERHLTLPDPPEDLRLLLAEGGVAAWYEPVEIPTYAPHEPSQYPMYLDHRVYQGSSGRVYPLPFIEGIDREAHPRLWQAIHIENRYIRLMVLPELGGRIHVAYDKVNRYDFFYRNNVIKPALVGLTGPWISGGVEFNWPQHHRPATFLPVESTIERREDGSVTVWCSDHDPFARMQGTHGIRIHPERSVIELDVRLHNRTSERQTFLWWANVAVRVHNDYQSFFPEDVRYVADHARRAVTAFPRADRPYYGVDYPARAREISDGDRIDFYRNIPVPTSYMVTSTEDEFFGGYDHAAGGGFIHWADRRISPGKKQWTWGNAPFGHAWDAHLTDGGGPYVELMAGVYTDNQPDFSWLAPGETKRFTQYWYPLPALGVAHQATPYAAVHIDREPRLRAAFSVTQAYPHVTARITRADGTLVLGETAALEPGEVFRVGIEGPHEEGMQVELVDAAEAKALVTWRARQPDETEPPTAKAPPAPEDVASNDELYAIGIHLLQYRHPTRSPLPYWEEALRRDTNDSRVRMALGDLAYRSGDYESAHGHATVALRRITRFNGNPRDCEAYYLLGLIEARRGNTKQAADAFAKAGWDATYAGAAGLEQTRLLSRSGRAEQALSDLDTLDFVSGSDSRRASLKVLLLRRLGRGMEAEKELARALTADPLNDMLRYLQTETIPNEAGLAKDLALELLGAGETEAALAVLETAAHFEPSPAGNIAPIAHYHRASILDRTGSPAEAAAERRLARSSDPRWCFPSGLDDHDVLVAALNTDQDPLAATLLGMLLYDVGRRREALSLWEEAIRLGADSPLVHRNAGLAAYNVANDPPRALEHYERARALDPQNARLLFEHDQLAKRVGEQNPQRLARLETDVELVLSRDDLTVEYAELLTETGRAAKALELIQSRQFQPWEGGEGRVLAVWDTARRLLGLPPGDPPASLGEERSPYSAPMSRHPDGQVDFFATSLPELLLFSQPEQPLIEREP